MKEKEYVKFTYVNARKEDKPEFKSQTQLCYLVNDVRIGGKDTTNFFNGRKKAKFFTRAMIQLETGKRQTVWR